MITYPDTRQQGCKVSYWGILLLGAILIACFLFFIRGLELHRLVAVFEGPFQRSFSFSLQRISRVLVFELRETPGRIAHMCSLLVAHHQLSSAEQINHQSTYRHGVAEQHLLCGSSLILQAHLTVAFVCLKSCT